MCGITGIVSLDGRANGIAEKLYKMTSALRHRGPDDEGYILFSENNTVLAGGADTPTQVFESVFSYKPTIRISEIKADFILGLGHRRLSIIDPSPAGHQPMSYAGNSYWLIFNGEIYNYKELRAELNSKGLSFNTETDSEVLLAAYTQWGKNCINHFNGMWSFVIYDVQKNLLFGSRDRFGVKPFYYSLEKNFFAFASEQKALLSILEKTKSINEKAAFEYLVLGRTETHEQGLFNNILELLPAHSFYMDLKTGKLSIEKYYELDSNQSLEDFDEKKFKEYSCQTKELLVNATKRRLRADVSVGTCLSGGLDSSSLACIIDELIKTETYNQIGQKQKVFTACYHNESIDESNWAGKVVEATNTTWFKIFPDAEGLLNHLEDLTYSQDIPILGSSTFAQYCVMKGVAKEGVKVTLDGQGADELFAGYAPHYVSYFYELLRKGSLREMYYNISNKHDGFSDPKYLFLFGAKRVMNSLSIANTNFVFKHIRKEFKYLQTDFWNRYKEDLNHSQEGLTTNLNEVLKHQFTNQNLKVLLRTGDRNSMRFSVESRMPFADDVHLIEYLFSIPSVYKIRNGQSKSLLRSAMKGILPEEVRLRKDKLGFATPQQKWLRQIKDDLRQYITNDLDQWIDSKALLRDWDHLFSSSTGSSQRLFRVIQFCVWKKVFRL